MVTCRPCSGILCSLNAPTTYVDPKTHWVSDDLMSGLQESRPARAVIEQYNTLGLCISYAQKVHRLPLKLNSPALKDVDAQPHSEQQKAKISQARLKNSKCLHMQ